MIEFYPQIKAMHIAMVLLSGALFALRGAGVLAGGRWAMSLPVRWGSYAVDTALLTAAMMLLTFLPSQLFANGWLTVKIALLVVYVVLGTFALKRARSPRARAVFYVLALLTYGWMLTIARAHQPLGILQTLLG